MTENIFTFVSVAFVLTSLLGCGSSTEPTPDGHTREWINLRGVYQAVELDGRKITPTGTADPCPEDGPGITLVYRFFDGRPDPTEEDTYVASLTSCTIGYFDSDGTYRATDDSIFFTPTGPGRHVFVHPSEWLDEGRTRFRMVRIDSTVTFSRLVVDTLGEYIFEKCGEDPEVGCVE